MYSAPPYTFISCEEYVNKGKLQLENKKDNFIFVHPEGKQRVRIVRERTGCCMMLSKKELVVSNWDVETAVFNIINKKHSNTII